MDLCLQRDGQLRHIFKRVLDQFADGFLLGFRDLQKKFIVNLQKQPVLCSPRFPLDPGVPCIRGIRLLSA